MRSAVLAALALAALGCGSWNETDYRPFAFCSPDRTCPPGQECTSWGVCMRSCTACASGDCGCGQAGWGPGTLACVDGFCQLPCVPSSGGNDGCWGSQTCDPGAAICRSQCNYGSVGGGNVVGAGRTCPPGSTCIDPAQGGGGEPFCRPGSQGDGGVPGDGGVYEPLARRGFGATLGLDGRIFVAGGTAGGSEQTRFEAFTPATGKWEKLSDLPATRTELLLAAGNNGRLYALLGFQNLWLSDLVTAYDVDGRTWSTESPAPIARAHVAGASMGMGGGPIYVFGGLREAGGDTDQVWSFDAMSGMWSSHSPMPDTRYDFAAANLVADQFYLIGGTGGMGDLDSVLLYAAFSDRWSVPPMGARLASPRSDLAAAAARNATGIMIVVALGGRRHEQVLDTVEILDTTTGWRSGTPMPVPRAAFAAVTGPDGRHVYVIGGTDGSGRDINRVDIYDAGSDSWSTP